jgi:hypothetical protein
MKKIIFANKIFFLDTYLRPYDNKILGIYHIKDLFSRKNFNCCYIGNLNLENYRSRIFEIEKLDKPFDYISYHTLQTIDYKIVRIFSIEEQKEYIKKHPELLI